MLKRGDARATRLCCVRSGIGSARHERGTPLHTSRVSQSLTRRPVRSAQKLRALLHTRTYVYPDYSVRLSSRLIASHRIAARELAGRRIASDGSGAACVARARGRGTGSAEQRGSSGKGERREAARRAVLGDWASRSRQRGATGQSGSGSRLDSTRTRRDALHTVRTSRCRRRVAAARICCVRRAIRRDNDADVCAHAMHSCVLALPLARAAGDAAPPKREQSEARARSPTPEPKNPSALHCTAQARRHTLQNSTPVSPQHTVHSIHYKYTIFVIASLECTAQNVHNRIARLLYFAQLIGSCDTCNYAVLCCTNKGAVNRIDQKRAADTQRYCVLCCECAPRRDAMRCDGRELRAQLISN